MQESAQSTAQEGGERLATGFKTEHGSVYQYDAERSVTRNKTATGEVFEKRKVTVFVDLDQDSADFVLRALTYKNLVCVAEHVGSDKPPKLITRMSDIGNPDRVYLIVSNRDRKMLKAIKASAEPRLGYSVFDELGAEASDTAWVIKEPHLGHKVTEIMH